ncbi:MAG: chorismate synthase [FCB group bacterium]|nr:chorismate synthase [FCB group bacterium]
MLKKIRLLTAGESHGRGLSGIIEGIPSGLPIGEDYINQQLARRQLGYGRGGRMKIETDRTEIYAGVRFGKTLGSPIALLIKNRDWVNWSGKMSVEDTENQPAKITLPRPGHADLAGIEKFGFDDIRNVLERSSARETAMRVALGSICRKLLSEVGITVGSRVIQIHKIFDLVDLPENISPAEINRQADASPVRCLGTAAGNEMVEAIDKARETGDTLGGAFEILANGLPFGLGAYTHWDKKLNARVTAAVASINGIKGVEIGRGFEASGLSGSEMQDEIGWHDGKYVRSSNNAGGIEGGLSNGQTLVVRAAMKPIPTLRKALRSVDIKTKKPQSAHIERSDVCAVPAAAVIGESMLCLVLADALLEKFGGDSLDQLMGHLKVSGRY